jgi:hypothetical protein
VSAKEYSVSEIAELLGLGEAKPGQPAPDPRMVVQRARRILVREGIARRHGPRGWYYATESDLRRALDHVWQEAIKRRMGVG